MANVQGAEVQVFILSQIDDLATVKGKGLTPQRLSLRLVLQLLLGPDSHMMMRARARSLGRAGPGLGACRQEASALRHGHTESQPNRLW